MNFYLATEMRESPFTDPLSLQIFEKHKFCISDKSKDADIIVAHNYKRLLPFIIRYPKKKFLVWTNEPRYDTVFKNELKIISGLPNIQIMNVYGKDVFWHNLHFLSSYHFDNCNDLGIHIDKFLDHLTKSKIKLLDKKYKIAALFTYSNNKSKLMKEGTNIDLVQKRCEYALAGYKRKLLHIYGNKWPNGYALENSGFGFEKEKPWWTKKIEILNEYKFNLCFENTAHHYYITEKIWHAIVSFTLPIYHSLNSSVYEIFPENSFVDAHQFTDVHAMFDYIENMSDDEYLERLNLCIDVFNHSLQMKKENYNMNAHDIISKIINRVSN